MEKMGSWKPSLCEPLYGYNNKKTAMTIDASKVNKSIERIREERSHNKIKNYEEYNKKTNELLNDDKLS